MTPDSLPSPMSAEEITRAAPRPGETWSDADTRKQRGNPDGPNFVATIEGVWPSSEVTVVMGHTQWPRVAYRRATGGPLVNLRLDSFLWRFRRIASKPTGPFE
jgi:hypothetical protein